MRSPPMLFSLILGEVRKLAMKILLVKAAEIKLDLRRFCFVKSKRLAMGYTISGLISVVLTNEIPLKY